MVSVTNHREGRVISVVRLKTPESVVIRRELAMINKESRSKMTVVRMTYKDGET
jgi:hypothetical protein